MSGSSLGKRILEYPLWRTLRHIRTHVRIFPARRRKILQGNIVGGVQLDFPRASEKDYSDTPGRGVRRPAPWRRESGTSIARHRASHTSRAGIPRSSASRAVRDPSSASTTSLRTTAPYADPNSSSTASWSSLSFTVSYRSTRLPPPNHRSTEHEVGVKLRNKRIRQAVRNHGQPLKHRDSVTDLVHDYRDRRVKCIGN